jgi:hypothetical protein
MHRDAARTPLRAHALRAAAASALLLVSACLPASEAGVTMNVAGPDVGFDPYSAALPESGGLAQDILDLTFRMESGRALPVLSRFEGPVTVRLAGDVPPAARTDLGRLLARLRGEAGIDISETEGAAAVTITFLPRARIQATYANVACFVVPGVSDWAGFRANRNSAATDWAQLTVRTRVAIFIPSDSSPQEARDCLHEELAQALGPVNDLYRLSDSVFNDDNFHNVLTPFDMLVLRALYAPELRPGMTPQAVADRLPAILAGFGADVQGSAGGSTPRAWTNAIEVALSGRGTTAQRELSARQAIGLAREQGWADGRLALSYFALGRLTLSRDPETAFSALTEAREIYAALPGGTVQAAHVDMQLAAMALTRGDHQVVLALAEQALPVGAGAENAAIVATLLMMKAEALDALGQPAAAEAARMDSRTWGRYGFGSDEMVRARMAEIAVIARHPG